MPSLSLDVPDSQLVKNLDRRIEDSRSYWDKPEGFNLSAARNENLRLYLGRQIDVSHLYRFQVPFVENQIFVATEAIVAYLTNQRPMPEAYPAQDTIASKKMAIDLEKALMGHSQKFRLDRILETCVRDLLIKRLGVIYLSFDPDHGPNGEIVPIAVNPEHIVVDKNATMTGNPGFVAHFLKYSVEELIHEYPEKKKAIMEELGIQRGTMKQMSQEIAVRRVWVTYYDKKQEPYEGCVTYFGSLMLSKYLNPNWNYASGKNFLDMPEKPFIFLNYINDGQHLIDLTTPIEQAANPQNILNKRGRQIMENADKANGLLVISTESGLTKDDAQNMTGDPNQKLVIKTNGQPINSLIYQVPPHDLPSYVMDDKVDERNTILNIMGAPSEFTGADSDTNDNEQTLGQSIMAKNQASGRQDLIVRAISDFMDHYFKQLTQMMCVWYTGKHYFVYNGGDGEFDHITMHRDLIEDGMVVGVRAGSVGPFDKSRQEAVALQLAKMQMISPFDLYKDLHMDNTQKRYDNWFKWKTDPAALARDAFDEVDDMEAYVDFITIMNGKQAKPRDEATREHVLSHRKQMLTDKFLKAKKQYQLAFIEHIEKELNSLELRMALDQMSQEDPAALNPSVPIQPPMPAQPTVSSGMPGAAPMGMASPPGMAPPGMPGAPPQTGASMAGVPFGPPNLSAIMQGTNIPNPASPQMPPAGNVTALPPL